MRYLASGILVGMGASYFIETFSPHAKGIASLVVVVCIVLGIITKDHFEKKKS